MKNNYKLYVVHLFPASMHAFILILKQLVTNKNVNSKILL